MKIIYIVDGGKKVGLGHVYQSISFAKALKDLAEVIFLTQSDATIVNKITAAGFRTHQMVDSLEILEFLWKNTPDIVIIDKIDVPENLACSIKKMSKVKLVIFTNLTNANRYADIAVTADIGSNFKNIRYMDNETGTLYFYGPKYWVLRSEFSEYKKRKKMRSGTVKTILLIFGGSDPANLTSCTVKELLNQPVDYNINVILGASFGHIEALNEVLAQNNVRKNRVHILKDVSNVAELMYHADLVIASPGLSAFEALYVGTPILVLPQDELQRETYQGFFKVINKDEIGILGESIANRDFAYPDQEDIVLMDIAGGIEELIEEIIGDLK